MVSTNLPSPVLPLWPGFGGGGAGRSHTHTIDQSKLLVQPDPRDQQQGTDEPDPLSLTSGFKAVGIPAPQRASGPLSGLSAALQSGVVTISAATGESGLATEPHSAGSHTQVAGSTSADPAAVAAPAPLSFSRGNQAWDQARVDGLISTQGLQPGWLPDMRAVAPTQLQIQNSQQRELLRFSNAIANTGAGHLQVRRGEPLDPLSTDPAEQALIATAISLGLNPYEVAVTAQDLLDAEGNTAAVVGDAALSEFHPEHRHFHIG